MISGDRLSKSFRGRGPSWVLPPSAHSPDALAPERGGERAAVWNRMKTLPVDYPKRGALVETLRVFGASLTNESRVLKN